MAATCHLSRECNRVALLCAEAGERREASVEGGPGVLPLREMLHGEMEPEIESSSMSKRLIRSLSHKLKKIGRSSNREEQEKEKRNSNSGCLGFYGRGGGCRVGADTFDGIALFGDSTFRRNSSAGEGGYGCVSLDTGFGRLGGVCSSSEDQWSRVDCFSYGGAERFWRRNSRKAIEDRRLDSSNDLSSPSCENRVAMLSDDILQMCLARASLTTIMNARLVCKRWNLLASTSHFMQMRQDFKFQTPWIFLFGAVKNGLCVGQVRALDVTADKWHKIEAECLKGRFLFSVISVGTSVYIVGGCSNISNSGQVEGFGYRKHREVVVFNPLSSSWSKAASMHNARSTPSLGVFEAYDLNHGVLMKQWSSNSRGGASQLCNSRSRMRRVSEVYDDPHKFSQRRHIGDAISETDPPLESRGQPSCSSTSHNFENGNAKARRFFLIVVGGRGLWDEPLVSGEIYDSLSNRWVEIERLPADFGAVCTGAVCNRRFYVYSESDKLAAYDLERGVWIGIQTAHSPLHIHRYLPKLVSCCDRLFMLCVSWCERDGRVNREDNKATRILWELDVGLHTWREVSRHPDAPMDQEAEFVADNGRIYGVEMFKIFGQVLDFLTSCDVSDSTMKWSRITRKHVALDLDAHSCWTKSLVVLPL
ncbi:hypothetical protein AMTRI_Chr09g33800 [Amborella trichopoda]